MGKKNQEPDPGSTSGINIRDNISESLETIFWAIDTQILLSGSGIRNLFDPGPGIRDKHPGSAKLVALLGSEINHYGSTHCT
jgi:hypothetical protein